MGAARRQAVSRARCKVRLPGGFQAHARNLWPDGQQMVFVTFDPSVKGHPENKDVMLRIMTLKEKKITVLAKLFGGQGTMNVPSWSPDGKQFAFVSYQLVSKESVVK